jgi:hypothetical protein
MPSYSPKYSLDVGRNLLWPRFRWPGAMAVARPSTGMVVRRGLRAALIVDDAREPAGLAVLRTATGEICRAPAPPAEPDGGWIGYHAEFTTMKVASYVA